MEFEKAYFGSTMRRKHFSHHVSNGDERRLNNGSFGYSYSMLAINLHYVCHDIMLTGVVPTKLFCKQMSGGGNGSRIRMMFG